MEGLAVRHDAVPIGDDDDRNAIGHEHLHRAAVDGGAPEELRLIDVGDVEDHQPAVPVQVVEAIAVQAIEVGLLHGARRRR